MKHGRLSMPARRPAVAATWIRAAAVAAACGAAALFAGCGSYNPLEGSRAERYEDRDSDLVLRYCAYAAANVPDLEECVRHVEPSDVRSAEGNAGRYASGRLNRCREDAGPYCGKIGP